MAVSDQSDTGKRDHDSGIAGFSDVAPMDALLPEPPQVNESLSLLYTSVADFDLFVPSACVSITSVSTAVQFLCS